MAELAVYYESRPVGVIETHEDGPSFVYDPAWLRTRGAFPLSMTMPLSPRRIAPRVFVPWAANLLPEASQLRAVGLKLGAAPEDVVAILSEIGRDTAGALSIGKPGSASSGGWRTIPGEAVLERIIEELPNKPFLVGEDGVSMSLAGVQSKLGVAVTSDGGLAIPHDGAPSTHILKPDSDRLFGGVQNEALCLVLARRLGLTAPAVSTGRAGRRSYLLVTRYDRLEQAGRWRRLHQEDFCQALGKPPSAKYESNQTGIRGPSLADMFALTRNAMRAPDVLALLDYVILNVLACNTDAHAKNYSLMISGRGFTLAPIYDVMCAAVWDGVTRNLAQKIAGQRRGEHLKRRNWQVFAGDCGLNASRLMARVKALALATLAEARSAAEEVAAMPAGPHPLLPKVVEAIEARARALLIGLDDTETAAAEAEGAAAEASPQAEPQASPAPPKRRRSAKARQPARRGRV
ncbi:MAG: type II toxin-antitoxin system HipA family toxin [Hyphomicrobiaceae bacterium]